MLFCSRVNDIRCVEVGIVSMTPTMRRTVSNLWVETRAWVELFLVLSIAPSQNAANERLECIQRDAMVAQAREELGLNAAA